MASKKLQYKDIAEEQLLEPIIEEAKTLLQLFGEMKKELKQLAKESKELAKQTPLAGFKSIETLLKAIEKVKKSDRRP